MSVIKSSQAASDNDDLVLVDGEKEEQDNNINDDEDEDEESTDDDNNENGNDDPGTRRQVVGAGVAGGITGLVLGGPLLGLVGAGGAAAVAKTSRGKPGDFARKSGDVMASAGDRIKKYDEKHRVVEKTSGSIRKGCEWVSKSEVGRKSGDAVARASDRLKKYDEKHRVVEKTSGSITKGCQWVSNKFSKSEPNLQPQTAAA